MANQKKLKAVQSVSGQVTLPGSKSITNRILLLSAIADGATTIIGPLFSDDTLHMIDALKKLQVDLTQKDNGDILIHGTRGNFKNKSAEIFLGNAGTAFRPLTAALSFSKGQYTLSGLPRMHERPIKDLVDALLQLNADITYLGQEGYPPLKISPSEIMINGPIKIRGDISSQFLTSLLMAMPLTKKEVVITSRVMACQKQSTILRTCSSSCPAACSTRRAPAGTSRTRRRSSALREDPRAQRP